MNFTKRSFLSALGATGLASTGCSTAGSTQQSEISLANAGQSAFPDLAANVQPISAVEHRQRIMRAQQLMQEQGVSALILEAGSAMTYFTGAQWWRSERFTGVVIPREGAIAVITPVFEEPSVRESLKVGDDVRTWHEDANPFELVAGVLADRGLTGGQLAMEETVRHFVSDGIGQSAPAFELVSGMSITRGCRMFKSPAELTLMQTATDITMAAYRHVFAEIEDGMSTSEVSAMMSAATQAMGGAVEFSMVLLNEASAYPHGSGALQSVREGTTILMDCGCSVHGYESDVSRTWVYGDPTPKQRDVWNTVKRGQEMALEAAQIGIPAGAVDDVVRSYYESLGYGPGYKTPGLSHRLGHGIGLDGHEPVNFVHGETTPLAPGMCFSNEPGIYIFGEFGVRLEDCLYMTDAGPKLFSTLSPSIDHPFG